MTVTPYASLNTKNLEINGFTNLGQYTPEHQLNTLADHGLVLLYQPFRGSWVQPLAAFLSKNAAPGHVLAQIILEAIVLLENSGFFVDGIVSDGAQWNRSMWRQFGCDTENPTCCHPCDQNEERKLFFLSDFPHLVKNFRNWIVKVRTFETPDGIVNIQYWEKMLNIENENSKYGLKSCKLNKHHINPENYEKMKVGLAYQFFGYDIAKAMEFFKNERDELAGCEATIKFMLRMHSLILAMNSKSLKGALGSNSPELKVIEEFITYMQDCRNLNSKFMTDNTFEGFEATLRATLPLFHYLHNDHYYKYLMTCRLNQNNLEKFFGIIRSHCGSHDHPNSLMFLQIYRLLNVYSLIKPPKNTNVENVCPEIMKNLLDLKKMQDSDKQDVEKRNEFYQMMDKIVDQGVDFSELIELTEISQALYYFCGYVARKAKCFTSCLQCIHSLTSEECGRSNLIVIRDQFGLTYPSTSLTQFAAAVENVILTKVDDEIVQKTPLYILEKLYEDEVELPLLGCCDNNHKAALTRQILKFLLVVRLYFILKIVNQENNRKTKKKKERV